MTYVEHTWDVYVTSWMPDEQMNADSTLNLDYVLMSTIECLIEGGWNKWGGGVENSSKLN